MAIMIDCAIDTTLDLAYADAQKVTALPFKNGLYRKTENDGQALFQWLKTDAKFFKEEVFRGKNCDNTYGFVYVGDAWLEHLDWDYISDRYKDAYGQRPHFLKEWFAKMVGLPYSLETTMFFCNPIESHLHSPKWNRQQLQKQMES